jgi:hypothetical protein
MKSQAAVGSRAEDVDGALVPCRPMPERLRPIQYAPSGFFGPGGTVVSRGLEVLT